MTTAWPRSAAVCQAALPFHVVIACHRSSIHPLDHPPTLAHLSIFISNCRGEKAISACRMVEDEVDDDDDGQRGGWRQNSAIIIMNQAEARRVMRIMKPARPPARCFYPADEAPLAARDIHLLVSQSISGERRRVHSGSRQAAIAPTYLVISISISIIDCYPLSSFIFHLWSLIFGGKVRARGGGRENEIAVDWLIATWLLSSK